MKKLSLIGVGMIIAVLVLAAAGLAFAQEPTPPTPEFPYGHGSMDKRGFGGGMMGGRGSGGAWSEDAHGPMHEYMLAAWADLFDNMDVEDLEARLDEGETMWDVAQEKGLTQDEFFEQMVAVRTAAIEKMVAAGEIDQEWADWMLERGAALVAARMAAMVLAPTEGQAGVGARRRKVRLDRIYNHRLLPKHPEPYPISMD